MPNRDLEDTQPVLAQNNSKSPSLKTSAAGAQSRRWLWLLIATLFITTAWASSALTGYRSGLTAHGELIATQSEAGLKEQYELGVHDIAAGRYEVARQRLEYVLAQDPTFPGLTDQLAQLNEILFATTTPTASLPPTPTITLTPTIDLRPVQDRLSHALSMLAANDWSAVIDILVALRKEDRAYMVAKVDGLLYLALRNRGVDKIYQQSNLEGGIYDLALAENFGPLDSEAEAARSVARLYMIGSSFWEVYPEQAVYYFSQVAAAAPYLRDASGWTARERYRGALIQYGDQIAKNGDWCRALEQYLLAQAIRNDDALVALITAASQGCNPATATYAGTPTISPTPSPTITTTGLPWTATPPFPTASSTLIPTIASTTETPTLPPPPTDTPTPPPPPTETPTP
jgi:hypothetical protein